MSQIYNIRKISKRQKSHKIFRVTCFFFNFRPDLKNIFPYKTCKLGRWWSPLLEYKHFCSKSYMLPQLLLLPKKSLKSSGFFSHTNNNSVRICLQTTTQPTSVIVETFWGPSQSEKLVAVRWFGILVWNLLEEKSTTRNKIGTVLVFYGPCRVQRITDKLI